MVAPVNLQCVISDVLYFYQLETFNVEERAFGWQETVCPLRVQIMHTLRPYLQLFENVTDFYEKHE